MSTSDVSKNTANEELERQYAITRSLCDIYNSAHEVNLLENHFTEITSNEFIVKAMGHEGPADKALDMVAHLFAAPEYVKEMEEFTDFTTLRDRLTKSNPLYHEFIGNYHGWTRAGFVVTKCDENGIPSHAIFTTQTIDAAKKKELQLIKDLKDAVDAANRATKAKSDFLSHMSHEIRTPINAVLGMNELILRESKEANILEYAATISENGKALLSIINSVLDFSKIEAGHIDILPESYELSSLINDSYHLVCAKAQAKKLDLNVKCDESLPASAIGDMPHIRQIITNLLTNAIKYTQQGHIDFIVHGEGAGKNFKLIVDVKDTGMGIRPEDMDKLFGQFERFDLETNQNVEGTGLGLAIAKQLAQLMGGDITVESQYEKGSTFTLTLPQPTYTDAKIGKLSFTHSEEQLIAEQKKEHFKAPGAKVLVVDDVSINLTVFAKLISKSEVKCDRALSGEEALLHTLSEKYDLIFMDHMMPGMNGVEAMGAIREQENGMNKTTPVIMLTANAIGGMREQYLKVGFTDYLSKPIQPDKLEEMLRKYL